MGYREKGKFPYVQIYGTEFGKDNEGHAVFIECPSECAYPPWNPLRDDAQAMALEDWLLERGNISYTSPIFLNNDSRKLRFYGYDDTELSLKWHDRATRRRAICLCVARMQQAREGER